MPQAFLFLTRNYGAGFGAPPATVQFTRDGKPAPVDTSKPVRVELDDAELAATRLAFSNLAPTGNKGEFSFDCETRGAGGFAGAFVADRDLTEGEEPLRVPFAGVILEEEGATGAQVNFGGGAAKPAPVAEPAPPATPSEPA